jgi:hypothetical protein
MTKNHWIALILKFLPIALVLSAGWSLRLVNLGYADYQGDEIKAFYLPTPEQSISDFLFTQRKGPIQFIITGLLTLIDPLYENEFLMRILFALAGCLALAFFYLLLASLFGKRISLFASFFMATNGFLVGLSRIAQYQSYVILGGILALYFFDKAGKDRRFAISGIYLGMVSWAVAFLAHYDALLIAPMALFLLWEWRLSGIKPWRVKIKHLLVASGLAILPVMFFYVPFLFHIDAETKAYWTTRLVGEAAEKLSSSTLLFQIYQPVYVIVVYISLFVVGLIYCVWVFLRKRTAIIPAFGLPDIPARKFQKNLLAALAWFLMAFLFMEVIIYQPGTHMYTYLIPAFIFIGLGVFAIEQLIQLFKGRQNLKLLFQVTISGLFLFIFLQSYAIFVDHTQEYPWENEQFYFWTLRSPSPDVTERYALSMFGFPYFRDWENIGEFIREHSDFNSVGANEPDAVTNFYVRKSGRRFSPYRYYISIKNPRSFVPILNERMAEIIQTQKPVQIFEARGKTLAEIYLIEN